jgi:WD40 repeat protein
LDFQWDAFSPDGRWLVTGAQAEFRLCRVGSWRLDRTIARDSGDEMTELIAFTGDGRSMAITPSQRRARLVETATGRVLAKLAVPGPRQIRGLCFSPGDSQLAATTDERAVQVWDLRQIHRQLAAKGLTGMPIRP